MARLIWSPKAADNFEQILTYLDQHSTAAASQFAVELMELIESIPEEAMGGPMVPELLLPEIRE